MTRSWSPDGTIVSHEEIEILPRYQNEGLGRALTGNMFAHYRESGVKLVRLSAAPDLGNYVWARAGFAPGNETAEYMQTGLRWNLDRYVHDKSLREKARPLIDDMGKDPKTIWKIADLSDKSRAPRAGNATRKGAPHGSAVVRLDQVGRHRSHGTSRRLGESEASQEGRTGAGP